jgi:hypothetical protein
MKLRGKTKLYRALVRSAFALALVGLAGCLETPDDGTTSIDDAGTSPSQVSVDAPARSPADDHVSPGVAPAAAPADAPVAPGTNRPFVFIKPGAPPPPTIYRGVGSDPN